MSIIYRSEKGAPLLADEIDGNFRELDARLKTLEDHPEIGEGLGKIQIQDDKIIFTGTFGTDFGTFSLPKTNLEPNSSPISSSNLLPLYEKATLPVEESLGKLAILLEEEGPQLIFFNGKLWQRFMKGASL